MAESLLERMEDMAPSLEIPIESAQQWVNDAIENLSLVIPENQMPRYSVLVSIPETSNFDVRRYRFLRPHKKGRPAYSIHSMRLEDLGNGLIKYNDRFPVAYIKDGKLYIKPGGGSVEALGYPTVEDIDNDNKIENLPVPLEQAALHYAIIKTITDKIYNLSDDLEKIGDFGPIDDLQQLPELSLDEETHTLELIGWPTAPENLPDIEFNEADKESLDDVSLTPPEFSDKQKYTKAKVTLDFDKVRKRAADDDIEMMQGELGKLRVQLEKYQQQIADELNKVQTAMNEFESRVQHSLQTGQLNIQKDTQVASLNSQTERFNRQQAVETALGKFNALVNEYSSKVEAINAENQALIAKFNAEVQAFVNKSQLDISAFQAKLEKILRAYEAENRIRLEAYNAKISAMTNNAQMLTQKAELMSASISRHQQQYESLVQNYMMSVQQEPQPIVYDPQDEEQQGQRRQRR